MITVINKYTEPNEGEYIGRGKHSPLGNPFSHMPGTLAQYQVLTRDEAVDKYEEHLRYKVRLRDPNFLRELERLAEIAKRGDLKLRCFCAPKRCHGDVIKKFIERYLQTGNWL